MATASGIMGMDGTYPLRTNTDDAPALDVLRMVRHHAGVWNPEVRLLGNVRARDIVRACNEVITGARKEVSDEMVERALLAFYKHATVENFPQVARDQMSAALKAVLST